MKQKRMMKLNLQLFADDPAPADPAPADPKPADPAPADPKPGGKKYTDEDVNSIIEKKLAEWQKKQDKKVEEAKKLAAMDAQQKAEYERDELKKKLEALTKKDTLSEMAKTARGMLSEKGVNISDDLLSVIVTEDAESTKANVDSFADAFLTAVQNAVAEKLGGKNPKAGSKTSTMTKDEIMAIADPELRQKKMVENRELFGI